MNNIKTDGIREIRRRFRNSLRRGTGEAILIARQHPEINFSRDVERSIFLDIDYDVQSDGLREKYYAELIELCKHKAEMILSVAQRLWSESKDYWLIARCFGIAGIFAASGSMQCKRAMYRRYFHRLPNSWITTGENDLIKADGITAIKHIMSLKGKRMRAGGYNADLCDLTDIESYQEDHPELDLMTELRNDTSNDADLQFFLDWQETFQKTSQEKKETSDTKNAWQTSSYEQIKSNIDSYRIIPAGPRSIRMLPEENFKKLADDFLLETVPLKQEKYMRIFSERQYPYDYKSLLSIARGKNFKQTRLVEYACRSLRFFKGADIREFAFNILCQTVGQQGGTYLFVSNYEPGDAAFLASVVKRAKSENKAHALAWGIVDIYENNMTPECREPLESLYDRINCGTHRLQILKLLDKNNVLSQRIRDEIPYDGSNYVREFAEELTKINHHIY